MKKRPCVFVQELKLNMRSVFTAVGVYTAVFTAVFTAVYTGCTVYTTTAAFLEKYHVQPPRPVPPPARYPTFLAPTPKPTHCCKLGILERQRQSSPPSATNPNPNPHPLPSRRLPRAAPERQVRRRASAALTVVPCTRTTTAWLTSRTPKAIGKPATSSSCGSC